MGAARAEADKVTYDVRDGQMDLSGGARFQQPGGSRLGLRLEGERISFHLTSGRLVVEQAKATFLEAKDAR
jgi:lipopolysaccharide export system protein LptA